jgi:hypothetical protein
MILRVPLRGLPRLVGRFRQHQPTDKGVVLRKFALVASACMVLLFASFAHAQQIDVAGGAGTILSANYNSSSQAYLPATEKGGTYPNFSADVLFKNRIGFNGEVAVRAKQGLYNNYQGFRPIFYDFNAVFAPRLAEKISAELMGGIGGESVRFYNPSGICYYSTGCLTHVSSNHLLVHFGGGVRYYFWHSFFVRPEAHLYWVHNNTQFSSSYVGRVGVSVGYTLGSK